MMEQFKFYILPSLVSFFAMIFLHRKILNCSFNLRKINTYIGAIIFLILNILNYLYVTGFLRFIVNTIIVIITIYIIFKSNISKIIGSAIVQQVLYFFSELLVALLLLLMGIEQSSISNNLFSFVLLNLSIVSVAFMLYYLPFVNNVINKFMIFLSRTNSLKKYSIAFIFFITLNILIVIIYFNSQNKYLIIINAIFIAIYSVIIYFLVNEKNINAKFKQENEMLLDSLNDYEKMLDYQRVNNHENKNQLLVIRSMISKNNKKAINYLDEIITEKRNDDEGLYTYAKIIPEGGLQGLVYQKMLKMKEYDIKINLNVDKAIRKIKFDKISSKTNYDLCKAVGIILDNSIEETIKLDEKEILISMYKDKDELVIEVSNRCKTIPDMLRLDENGYTTKTEGHGYGLCLLKKIVSNNSCITNERSLNKDIFTQIIKIKM